MGLSLPLAGGSIAQINRYFYFLMLGMAFFGTCLVYYLDRAPLGYGLRAIKEDEEAAGVLGINTTAYKVIAFVLSSFLAAVIGGTYAYWLTFIEPISMFDPVMSITTIIMVIWVEQGLFSACTWRSMHLVPVRVSFGLSSSAH